MSIIQNIFTVSECQVLRTVQKTMFETWKLKSFSWNRHSLVKCRTKSTALNLVVFWPNTICQFVPRKHPLRPFIPRDPHEFSFAFTGVTTTSHGKCRITFINYLLFPWTFAINVLCKQPLNPLFWGCQMNKFDCLTLIANDPI